MGACIEIFVRVNEYGGFYASTVPPTKEEVEYKKLYSRILNMRVEVSGKFKTWPNIEVSGEFKTTPGRVGCLVCGRTYANRYTLKAHIKRKHVFFDEDLEVYREGVETPDISEYSDVIFDCLFDDILAGVL